MAAPISPEPQRVQITATQVKVVRIKDNVARLQFGGQSWDVSILELGIDAAGNDTSKKLNLSDELASKVEAHFQKLVDEGVFDAARSRKVVLEGRRIEKSSPSSNSAPSEIDISIDTIKTQEDRDLHTVDDRTQQKALRILKDLGTILKEADVTLHNSLAPPSPQEKEQAAPNKPAAAPRKSGEKEVKSKVKKDPLQTQFATRSATLIKDPAQVLCNSFYKGSPSGVPHVQSLKNAMADYIGGTTFSRGKGFDKSPQFDLILSELQHIQKVDPDALKTSSEKFKAGLFSSVDFKPGELDSLLQNPSTLSDAQRSKLTQLYAQYLRDGHKGMGIGFYEIFTQFSRDKSAPAAFQIYKQIVVLEEGQDRKLSIVQEYPQEPLSLGNRVYLLKKGNTYHLYDSKANAKLGLAALHSLANLKPSEEDETVHKDVGAGGRCADRSLAHQIFLREGNSSPTDAELSDKSKELRRLATQRLKQESFIPQIDESSADNSAKVMMLIESIKATLEAQSLPSQKLADELATILASIEGATLSNTIVQALTSLPKTGINGNLFERLKKHIHDAYKADTTHSHGRDSDDPDFGGSTIEAAKRQQISADYVRAALTNLIEELNNKADSIRAVTSKEGRLTGEEAQALRSLYADIVEHDPQAHLDQAFFAALSEVNDPRATPSPSRTNSNTFQIVIVRDNTGQDKESRPYILLNQFPGDGKPIDKQNALYIWYDGDDHYHSFQRQGEALDKLVP